jgi:hypothetical protein
VIFYFISKLSAQPLYSRQLAVFSFWLYLLGPQLPVSRPGCSARLDADSELHRQLASCRSCGWYSLQLVPDLAGHNRAKKQKDVSSKYVVFSAWPPVMAILIGCFPSGRSIKLWVDDFRKRVSTWTLYGFIGMAFFSAIYHIAPGSQRLIGQSSPDKSSFRTYRRRLVLVTLACC